MPKMSVEDWYQLQREDDCLSRVIKILENESDIDTFFRVEEPEVALLLRERSKLVLVDGVLYRTVFSQRGEVFNQLVLPSSQRELLKVSMMRQGTWVLKELWN